MNFAPLEKTDIEQFIKSAILTKSYSLIITLLDGDLIFGDLRLLSRVVSSIEEAETHGLFMPPQELNIDDFCLAYKLTPVVLAFNSIEGTIHGRAHSIELPNDVIAQLTPLPWHAESLLGHGFKNAPNPLASVIFEHDQYVADKYGLKLSLFLEMAMPTETISKKGITFSSSELIYADWDFFSRTSSHTLSIGIHGATFGMKNSIANLAYDKLNQGNLHSLRSRLSSSNPFQEIRIPGFFDVTDEQIQTELEGEACSVVMCSEFRNETAEYAKVPVLFKRRFVSYPMEFFPFINSKLIFFGELKQIPVTTETINCDYLLLARAIGYIPDIVQIS